MHTFVALDGEGKTSLVSKWAAELAAQDWPGCDAAFAWSFYSQGTREQLAASSDLFLKEALNFFALDDKDREFAASPAGAFEKGQRLASFVDQRRSLLILDGLEPLQYAPTAAESDHPHHAFHVMDSYVRWLQSGGAQGQRSLAILRLLGLFDRTASADCLRALWTGEAIVGLTEPLADLSEAQRNKSLTRLQDARLLTVNRDTSGALVSLDAHPHLREYFARQLRTQQLDAWRAAHRRLYEHLCASTKEGDQPTLEGLQPLYQAVAHGCQAGLQQEACNDTYFRRIRRGNEHYAPNKLGAWHSELGAIACFFETPWNQVSQTLAQPGQPWVLNEAAYTLRALGRLTEALEPMRAGIAGVVKLRDWMNAAIHAINLSELERTLGAVGGAVRDVEHSVTYVGRSGDAFMRMVSRTNHAGTQRWLRLVGQCNPFLKWRLACC